MTSQDRPIEIHILRLPSCFACAIPIHMSMADRLVQWYVVFFFKRQHPGKEWILHANMSLHAYVIMVGIQYAMLRKVRARKKNHAPRDWTSEVRPFSIQVPEGKPEQRPKASISTSGGGLIKVFPLLSVKAVVQPNLYASTPVFGVKPLLSQQSPFLPLFTSYHRRPPRSTPGSMPK